MPASPSPQPQDGGRWPACASSCRHPVRLGTTAPPEPACAVTSFPAALLADQRARVRVTPRTARLDADAAASETVVGARADELIQREGLRRCTGSFHTGSLRKERIYLEEIDESRVIRAANLRPGLQVPFGSIP